MQSRKQHHCIKRRPKIGNPMWWLSSGSYINSHQCYDSTWQCCVVETVRTGSPILSMERTVAHPSSCSVNTVPTGCILGSCNALVRQTLPRNGGKAVLTICLQHGSGDHDTNETPLTVHAERRSLLDLYCCSRHLSVSTVSALRASRTAPWMTQKT